MHSFLNFMFNKNSTPSTVMNYDYDDAFVTKIMTRQIYLLFFWIFLVFDLTNNFRVYMLDENV